jgi:hypothetical protein
MIYGGQFNDTTSEDGISENGRNITIEKRFNIIEKSTTGSWGLRAEHFLTKKFSVGLDIWYAKTTVIARCIRNDYENVIVSSSSGSSVKYVPLVVNSGSAIIFKDLSRLNTTLRFDLHMGRSPFFDPYLHVALGAAFYKFVVTSSNTEVHEETPFYVPLSFKIGSGAKFWLSKKLAGFVEVSIGGPIIAAGICYKMPYKLKLDLKENNNNY